MACLAAACALAFAAPPAPAADAARTTQARSLTIDGVQRTYRLHVPSGLDAARAAPLVLVFHGGGGTPEQVERETRFSELADRAGFVVAYPAGHRRSWNDGRGSDAVAAQRDGVDDVAFVRALIDDIATQSRIDAKRIYATGISNGAMFSHHLAVRLGSRLAAIAPVAGGVPEPLLSNFAPPGALSVLIVNGTLDPLVPYSGGEVSVLGRARGRVAGADESAQRWAAHDRCSATPIAEPVGTASSACTVTRVAYTGCRDGSSVELLRLDGGGHTWPGGSQYLPQRLVGAVCRDIDGSALIWDFFQRHAQP